MTPSHEQSRNQPGLDARSAMVVHHWLTVLLIAWVVALVASGILKIVAWLVLAASFIKLAVTVALSRNGKVALWWCAAFGLAGAVYELHPVTLGPSASGPAMIAAFAVPAVVIFSTIIAFGTVMGELAWLSGSRASMQHWRGVLRWQLYTIAGLALLIATAKALGAPVDADGAVTVDGPLALLVGIVLVVVVAYALIVAPALGIRRLQRHLQEHCVGAPLQRSDPS